MNIFPFLHQQTVAMMLGGDELVLAWVEKKEDWYCIQGFARHRLPPCAVVESRLCNPAVVHRYIVDFLHKYRLSSPVFYCALSGSGIVEHIFSSSTAVPLAVDFAHEKISDKRWNSLFLYAPGDAQFVWYCAGIDYTLLFAYILFAQSRGLHVVVFSTPFLSHVAAYKQLHRGVRHNLFAHDLQATGNDLSRLFTQQTLKKLVQIQTSTVDVERDFLVLHTLFGLLFVQGLMGQEGV